MVLLIQLDAAGGKADFERWCTGSSYWQGMAPGAYMAFSDIGSGQTGSLGPPTKLSQDFYPFPYAVYAFEYCHVYPCAHSAASSHDICKHTMS